MGTLPSLGNTLDVRGDRTTFSDSRASVHINPVRPIEQHSRRGFTCSLLLPVGAQ